VLERAGTLSPLTHVEHGAYDFPSMPKPRRPHRIQVKLSDSEFGALEALASAGRTKADVLRSALTASPAAARPETTTPPTRRHAIALLREAAEQGSVPAMAALERALRLGGEASEVRPGPISLDEIESELRAIP
jgi:hypothetical protein